MNIHHLGPSLSRWLVYMGSLMLAAGHVSGVDLSKFRRIEPQFIAALGDPAATSGNGAQSWGFWNQDPGPRACKLDHYPQLKASGVALRSIQPRYAPQAMAAMGVTARKPAATPMRMAST